VQKEHYFFCPASFAVPNQIQTPTPLFERENINWHQALKSNNLSQSLTIGVI
jgi:hypothetical protein